MMFSILENPPGLSMNETRIKIINRFTIAVFLVAVIAMLISYMPFWHAQSQTPPDWNFTGNVSNSPDIMQYRVWIRQSLKSGILVRNNFTTEPNKPHILVLFYYLIGKISTWSQITPEFIYAYAGVILAFVFVLVLYSTIKQFVASNYQAFWIFLAIFFGGGLGAILKILSNINFLQNISILKQTIWGGLWAWPVFEDYRGNYIFTALFDTHYMLIWLVNTLAIISFYFTLRKFSIIRILLTAILLALATLLHLYEGVTLLTIVLSVAFLFWVKKIASRSTYVTLFIAFAVLLISLALFSFLYQSSGLPNPTWRGINILFLTVLISYPIAWIVIAWGIKDYWKNAGLNETFLLGWMIGCLIITLSGPFYPYPDRGTLTLQIPIYIIAGHIFFSRRKTISLPIALLLIAVLGVSPAWTFQNWWEQTSFRTNDPAIFTNTDHTKIIETLKARATEDDVLIAEVSKPAWDSDLLWLAPEYPGKLYSGHFFLTVNYDEKVANLAQFYKSTPSEQYDFLKNENIRFVYVDAKSDPDRFQMVPGLSLLTRTSIGDLFEFEG